VNSGWENHSPFTIHYPPFTYPAWIQAAFWTLPPLMQRVQTFADFGALLTRILTFWTLGFQRRLVLLLAWLTLFPKEGAFPQISHFLDTVFLQRIHLIF